MKNILIIAAVLTLPSYVIAQSQTNESNHKSHVQAQSDTLNFTVYGMDCPGCEGGLEKQVNKIPAVQYCKANWVKQELNIVVKQDSSLNIAELEKRVKKANFTLDKNAIKNED
jgi:copper chaperone CopZ